MRPVRRTRLGESEDQRRTLLEIAAMELPARMGLVRTTWAASRLD
jgi:hypothetical protein